MTVRDFVATTAITIGVILMFLSGACWVFWTILDDMLFLLGAMFNVPLLVLAGGLITFGKFLWKDDLESHDPFWQEPDSQDQVSQDQNPQDQNRQDSET